MPLSLLIALFLAFGLDTPAPATVSARAMRFGIGGTLAMLALIAALSCCLGWWGAARASRPRTRRWFGLGIRAIDLATLAAFGAVIHAFGWPAVVRRGVPVGGWTVVQDALIVLPFVVMQLTSWWGVYAGERAMRPALPPERTAGLARHLVLRARQSLGLVLPVLLIFSLGQDLARRQWPGWSSSPWSQPVEVLAMGLLVMVASPLFVRLAWPTRPLPPGPLRDRLEHLARRLGFRCADILVWDTGGTMVNACVTGSLPRFRYVLLTDALIEFLDESEIAAVFGHEIGHIAHRHLLYFGFFFAGSLALLAILGDSIDEELFRLSRFLIGRSHPVLDTLLEAAAVLSAVGLYFLVVFGHVSRRFERQADVFGCRAVSCGQPDCPPHGDAPGLAAAAPSPGVLCPIGIRIFASALQNVAVLNGMETRARSWRHGSIARRIAFLEGLEGRPEALRRFETGVSRLRVVMALGLAAAVVIALAVDPARLLQ